MLTTAESHGTVCFLEDCISFPATHSGYECTLSLDYSLFLLFFFFTWLHETFPVFCAVIPLWLRLSQFFWWIRFPSPYQYYWSYHHGAKTPENFDSDRNHRIYVQRLGLCTMLPWHGRWVQNSILHEFRLLINRFRLDSQHTPPLKQRSTKCSGYLISP